MEFKTRPKRLSSCSLSMLGIEQSVRRSGATVGEVAKALNGSAHYDRIVRELRESQRNLDREAKNLQNFRQTLHKISDSYSTTEHSVMMLKPGKGLSLSNLMKIAKSVANWRDKTCPPCVHGWDPGRIAEILKNRSPWAVVGGIGAGIIPSIVNPDGVINFQDYLQRWRKEHGLEFPFPDQIPVDIEGQASVGNGSTTAEAGIDKENIGVHAGVGAVGSVIGASGAIKSGIFEAEGSVDVLKGEASANAEAGLMKDGKFDPHASAHAGVEVNVIDAKGSIKAGPASIDAEAKIGHAEAKGDVSASLFDKDGNLSPSVEAKAKAEATVAEGKVKTQIGSDRNNIHAEAEGKALTASAEAKVKVSKNGVEAKAGAEAYLAKGSIKGGYSFLGIKVDATLSGGAGGAGVTAGGKVTGSSASGKIGAGLLVGGDLEVSVDWSNSDIVKKYNSFQKNASKTVNNIIKSARTGFRGFSIGGGRHA